MSATVAEWARGWYARALWFARGERISKDFAHAYMALFCTTVPGPRGVVPPFLRVMDPLDVLRRIPPTAPPSSQYALHGVRALVLLSQERYVDALADLRKADSYSSLSGNRFLEGILLPAHAALAAALDPTYMPEARRAMRRAKRCAWLARSAFYDSQVDGAAAVLAKVQGKQGQTNRLWARAQRVPNGLLPLYEKILAFAHA
jgi:hypothetical protein